MPSLLGRNRGKTAPKDGEPQHSQHEPSPSTGHQNQAGWVDNEAWNVRNGPPLIAPSAKEPGENTSHSKKHGEVVHPPAPSPKKIQAAARDELAAKLSHKGNGEKETSVRDL